MWERDDGERTGTGFYRTGRGSRGAIPEEQALRAELAGAQARSLKFRTWAAIRICQGPSSDFPSALRMRDERGGRHVVAAGGHHADDVAVVVVGALQLGDVVGLAKRGDG